jgi:hypothetical protein
MRRHTEPRLLLFVSVLLVGLSMTPGWAHLLELPAKMSLSREQYLAVQQIYRGWALSGAVIFAALGSVIALAVTVRHSRAMFWLAVTSALCIALSLVVFFAFTYPANQATVNWTMLPDNWVELRRQWEYSHAAGAVLFFTAFTTLVAAAVARRAV